MSTTCSIISILFLGYFLDSFLIIYKEYHLSKNNWITKDIKISYRYKRNLCVIHKDTDDPQIKTFEMDILKYWKK
jgi:hypothetical protein